MLKHLRLVDFKSFADASVELAPLTLLVGANASGKSNVFDALRFLQGAGLDLSFEELLNGDKRGFWPGIRGGAVEAARVGTAAFTIESTWEVISGEAGAAPTTVSHGITCRSRPPIGLVAERLATETGEELVCTGPVENGRISLPWPPLRETGAGLSPSPGASRTLVGTDQSVLWTILGTVSPGSPQVPRRVVGYAQTLLSGLMQMRFLDIRPPLMRGYGRADDELGSHGENFSGALYDLCSVPERKAAVVGWLAELCAPELADIDFIRVEELGDIMAVLVEKDGKRITVRSLSDGTLRFLGTLVALFVAEPNAVFFIEELGEGLHPARIGLLMEWLGTLYRDRGIQVIATTHSPTVLQWLDEDALGSTVLVARTSEHEGAVMRRLRDLPRFFDVVRDVGIEEMFTTNWLELAL